MATCAGPPDTIAQGAATVIIGGMQAARMGDMTVHGGVVSTGCPTVLIGGPTATMLEIAVNSGIGQGQAAIAESESPPLLDIISGFPVIEIPNGDLKIGNNIIITGSPDFKTKALADLKIIGNTKTGTALFNTIDESKHNTVITKLDMATAQRIGGRATATDEDRGVCAFDPMEGSDTVIEYNPDLKKRLYGGEVRQLLQVGDSVNFPARLFLCHEMIHAVHNADATRSNELDPLDPTGNKEESRTIGINGFENEPLSERKLGEDLGAGFHRTDHDYSFVRDPDAGEVGSGGGGVSW